MTTFTRTWNAAYEANPADSQNASQGAARIREIKSDVQERLTVDHSMAGDVDDGAHKKITFVDPLATKPLQANDESYLYTKDVSATSELFYEDEAGNEVQLTDAGNINVFDSGTNMLFQQTAAPVGWTKITAHNDKALRIVSGTVGSGGASAFTTTFGTSKVTDSHNLSVAEMPVHGHTIGDADSSGTNNAFNTGRGGTIVANIPTSNTGGGGGHTHPLSNFDLQYVDFIIASKD